MFCRLYNKLFKNQYVFPNKKNFDFTATDIFTPLRILYDEYKYLKDFDITEINYRMIHIASLRYNNIFQWYGNISNKRVQSVGFKNLYEFKYKYILTILWYMRRKNYNLYYIMKTFYNNTKSNFSNSNIPYPLVNGNIIDYLMNYKVEHLLASNYFIDIM